MPYVYQVYVEYWDEEDDRFWFTTQQVVSESQISQREVLSEADDLIAQKLAGPQYEALRDFLAWGEFTPVETVTAAYWLPP